MTGVEERLDAETVAGREQRRGGLVPKHERELAAQMVQALHAEVLIEVQRDLAVGPRTQPVAAALELPLNRLETVELAVHDDARLLVLAGDRLIPGREVDDAQTRMAQPDAAVGGRPLSLPVRSAMRERLGGTGQRRRVNGFG